MNYSLVIPKSLEKKLKKLDKPILERLVKLIEKIKENPYQFKRLRYQLKGAFSARVAPFRVVFAVDEQNKKIIILAFEHRDKVYKK
jgi:mRNA-degrading endonuclease RelE of RelBE toxin-antitoxin system